MRLAIRLLIPTATLGLTLIACASTGSPPATSAPAASAASAKTATVNIKGFAFGPATITVAKGTKVTFSNQDSANHTVTSGANRTKDGKFDEPVDAGTQATITFDTPGTFEYFCTLHSSMKGTITVQ